MKGEGFELDLPGGRTVFQVRRPAAAEIWGQSSRAGAVDMMRLHTDQMKRKEAKTSRVW